LLDILRELLAGIESGAGCTEAGDAFCNRGPERGYLLEHVDAQWGDAVFDAGWDLGEDFAGGEAVALEGSESLGEGLLADALNLFHDTREAQRGACFCEDSHGPERPFVGEASNHLAGESVLIFGLGVAEFGGRGPASVFERVFHHGYPKVPTS
jgi:hypothetical protein